MCALARVCGCGWLVDLEIMKAITFNLEPLVVRTAMQNSKQGECVPYAFTELAQKLQCAPCARSATSTQCGPSAFTFTLRGVGAAGVASAGAVLGGVAKISPTPIANAALVLQRKIAPVSPPDTECVYMDQYSVGDARNPKEGCARLCELIHGVAISNDVEGRQGLISKLLGATGH